MVEGALSTRTVIFPYQTSHSYVEIIPMKEMELGAFTLCMQVATELTGARKIILFAYGKTDDELNVWRELNGGISLYLGDGYSDSFKVPDPGPLNSHLCLTWDSRTGATTVFMDGRRSLTKFLRKGHVIPAGAKFSWGRTRTTLNKCSRASMVKSVWSEKSPTSTCGTLFCQTGKSETCILGNQC